MEHWLVIHSFNRILGTAASTWMQHYDDGGIEIILQKFVQHTCDFMADSRTTPNFWLPIRQALRSFTTFIKIVMKPGKSEIHDNIEIIN